MKVSFFFLFFTATTVLANNLYDQNRCDYWLTRFDAIGFWEQGVLTAHERSDRDSEKYFRRNIRTEMYRIHRDAARSENESR